MNKHLLVLAGPDEGSVFPLSTQPLLVGRSRATEAKLIDPHVAPVHCQILWQDDHFVIRDFDSDAGTFLNGQRVSEHALKTGDMIRIGNTRLQLAESEAASPAAAAVAEKPKTARLGWAKELTGQKFGPYQIGALFAKSKTGCVFHARHTRKNLDVALKVLDPKYASSNALIQRFNRAMKAVLPLRHPNLVQVYGAGKTGPHCWVAMEFVRGESVAAVIGRIETVGMFDWRHVLRMQIYLTRALAYAHEHKLIHQCVTPQNVLVGKNLAKTKLADLMLDKAIERDPTLPLANGEPSEDLPYMSPERTDGPGKPVDSRTDTYSLGAVVYELLTGQPPFQAKTAADLVARIRLQSPPSMKLLHFGLPNRLNLRFSRCSPNGRKIGINRLRSCLPSWNAFAETQNVLL